MDLSKYERKIFSQNGEDGVTMALVELIYKDTSNKYYVEFGVQDGSECNTRILREKYKWNGLQMDGSHANESINLKKEFITKENVVELFKKYNVPSHINLLSVDIDFNDFYCLKEILKHYTCDIIICEYNATHLANEDKVVIYDKNGGWDCTNYFGASLLALNKLGERYNYTLVYCNDNGVNCFLVSNVKMIENNLELKDAGNVESLYRKARYSSGRNGGHPEDNMNRKYIVYDEAILL